MALSENTNVKSNFNLGWVAQAAEKSLDALQAIFARLDEFGGKGSGLSIASIFDPRNWMPGNGVDASYTQASPDGPAPLATASNRELPAVAATKIETGQTIAPEGSQLRQDFDRALAMGAPQAGVGPWEGRPDWAAGREASADPVISLDRGLVLDNALSFAPRNLNIGAAPRGQGQGAQVGMG